MSSITIEDPADATVELTDSGTSVTVGDAATVNVENVVGASSGAGFFTQEALNFPVDYNDAGSVDPVADTVFTTQAQIDTYLAEQGATNFKHLMAVWEAIPQLVAHTVTLTLAAGVHRPRVGESFDGQSTVAWPLRAKQTTTGAIHVKGSSTFTALAGLSALSITGVQTASGDPYLDFAGTPFAGLDLRGLLVELSTGQINVIHDHTDSRLRLTGNLSPDPTGGTCSVVRPGTELRNSFDDVSTAYSTFGLQVSVRGNNNGVTPTAGVPSVLQTKVLIDRCWINQFNTGFAWGLRAENDSTAHVFESLIDYTEVQATYGITPQGRPFQVGVRGTLVVWSVGVRGPIGSSVDDTYCGQDGTLQLRQSVLYGGTEGVNVQDGRLQIIASVIAQKSSYGVLAELGTSLGLFSFTGYYSEFRDIGGPALDLRSNSIFFDSSFEALSVKDCAKGILIGTGVVIDESTSLGFKDGGGNADVGFEFTGIGALIALSSGTDITGTNGDVRMADGTIYSYATIVATGPITDTDGNFIKKAA